MLLEQPTEEDSRECAPPNMKLLPLMVAMLYRKPARMVLTMLGVVVAFMLFGLLQGIDTAFSQALQHQKLDRMFVQSRHTRALPYAYRESIQRVAGVNRMTEAAFLPGYYQDARNTVLVIATEPAVWLHSGPDYTIPKSQEDAMAHTRSGAIITDWMARHYGLRVGDQLTVRTQVPTTDGGTDWAFQVVGIMTYPDSTAQLTLILANFAYFDEGRRNDRGTVNRYILQIDDPRHSARIARQIDALFATSNVPTRTESEHEMGQEEIASIGDFRYFSRTIIAAVFFALLMMTSNTMMESVRERTSELAVLKAVGFADRTIFALVLIEAIIPCVAAALIGLILAASVFPFAGSYMGTGLLVGTMILPPTVVLAGVAVAVGAACLSAGVPAWKASRLSVVDALTVR